MGGSLFHESKESTRSSGWVIMNLGMFVKCCLKLEEIRTEERRAWEFYQWDVRCLFCVRRSAGDWFVVSYCWAKYWSWKMETVFPRAELSRCVFLGFNVWNVCLTMLFYLTVGYCWRKKVFQLYLWLHSESILRELKNRFMLKILKMWIHDVSNWNDYHFDILKTYDQYWL